MVALTQECAEWIVGQHHTSLSNAMAGSVPFLRLISTATGCYMMAKGAVAARNKLDAGDSDKEFLLSKISTSQFYAAQIVPTVLSLKEIITSGDELFYAIDKNNMA